MRAYDHHDNGVYQYIDQGINNNVGLNFDYEARISSFNGGYPYNPHTLFSNEPRIPSTTHQQDFTLRLSKDDAAAVEQRGQKLGLKLTKTPSFLRSLEKFFTSHHDKKKKNPHSTTSQSDDKIVSSSENLKAANFPALSLQIGHWKRESNHAGDLVAKCYFKKQNLVWEALEGNLKIKLQFHWSDISAIAAEFPANGQGILKIILEKSPLFFREEEPQPRKHTNWKTCDDFTNKQASSIRIHTLEFAPGVLEKHYEKIIQADPKLFKLSQQPFPHQASPFFKDIRLNNELCFDQSSMAPSCYFPPQIGMSQHQRPRALGMEGTSTSSMSVVNFQGHISNYPYQLVHSPILSNQNFALDYYFDQDQVSSSTNYYQHQMSQWEVPTSSVDLADHFVDYEVPYVSDQMVDLKQPINYVLPQNNDMDLQMNQPSMSVPYPALSFDDLDQFSMVNKSIKINTMEESITMMEGRGSYNDSLEMSLKQQMIPPIDTFFKLY